MRTVNKTFKEIQQIEVDRIAKIAVLTPITENKDGKFITVGISYKNEFEEVVGAESYTVSGDNYDLIMSEKPSFSPNKPANEYREDDLWYILRLINPELPE